MNTSQKKEIIELIGSLDGFQQSLTTIAEDMRELWDNKSEKWQESEAGELMSSRISNIEEAVSNIEESASQLRESLE